MRPLFPTIFPSFTGYYCSTHFDLVTRSLLWLCVTDLVSSIHVVSLTQQAHYQWISYHFLLNNTHKHIIKKFSFCIKVWSKNRKMPGKNVHLEVKNLEELLGSLNVVQSRIKIRKSISYFFKELSRFFVCFFLFSLSTSRRNFCV